MVALLRSPAAGGAACAALAASGVALATAFFSPSAGEPIERRCSVSGHDLTPLSLAERARCFAQLAVARPDAARVASGGTERSFTGEHWDTTADGTYVSAACGLPLFKSADKFKCGCGWPSFSAPYDPEHVVESNDYSHDMVRVEVCEARTGAHLGHVFDDGPPPTYRRYCINSAMLIFVPEDEPLPKQIIAGATVDEAKQAVGDRAS
jgi:peptide-methionine (R)-S-oxide reductase